MAALARDGYCLTAMTLMRLNEFQAAMAVLLFIPIHKRGNPLAGFFFAFEWPVEVVRPVFNDSE